MDSLLPPNKTKLESHAEQVTSRIEKIDIPIRTLWDAQTCPANLLPWLAWALAVEPWDDQWTEQQKRNSIEVAIYVHQHKGTPGAVEKAVGALGYDLTLIEWFETVDKDPGTFGIDLRLETAQDLNSARILLNVINHTKNKRSHLWGIAYDLATLGTQVVAAAQSFGIAFHIQPEQLPVTWDGGTTWDNNTAWSQT